MTTATGANIEYRFEESRNLLQHPRRHDTILRLWRLRRETPGIGRQNALRGIADETSIRWSTRLVLNVQDDNRAAVLLRPLRTDDDQRVVTRCELLPTEKVPPHNVPSAAVWLRAVLRQGQDFALKVRRGPKSNQIFADFLSLSLPPLSV